LNFFSIRLLVYRLKTKKERGTMLLVPIKKGGGGAGSPKISAIFTIKLVHVSKRLYHGF
jgi:hypothetical protein